MSKQIAHPAFEELPLDRNGPRGNAWGRFGPKDELGMLNLLTPEVIADAAKEIKTGVRVSLDWTLDKPSYPSFGRQRFEQRIHNKAPRTVNDDILHFNTQCSSQWDGLRHYGFQNAKKFYNGVSQSDIESSGVLGIDVIAQAGGITGRGHLLDYAAYAQKNSLPLEPLTSSAIPLSALKQIATDHKIDFHPGDILFVRSGFTQAYDSLSSRQQKALSYRPEPDFIGVEAGVETLKWLWSHQFAAIAGDAVAWERAPIAGPHADTEHMVHQWALAGWGMPIGEMFDLERLAQECERQNRWTFFVSSVPLKVPGGVASPPNAVAIF